MSLFATSLSSNQPSDEILANIRRLQIRARRLAKMFLSGEYHSVFRGRGIEFSEVREYLTGDDVRTIDWNVTARMGTPYVKKFVEERELTVYLLVDVSPSSSFSSTETTKRALAAELAMLLGFAAVENNDRVGLIAFSDRIELFLPPKKGTQHVLRIARELIYLRPKGRGTDLAAPAELLMRVAKRRSIGFLISDFHAHGYEASMRFAAQKHELIALSLTDRRELELPRVGLLTLRDAETGAELLIDTDDQGERQRYATAAAAAQAARRRLLTSLGVDEVAIRTDRPYIRLLLAFFRARATRRAAA